jgi:ABC-type glycerol-3-phosphate transport system substrate-binding protein
MSRRRTALLAAVGALTVLVASACSSNSGSGSSTTSAPATSAPTSAAADTSSASSSAPSSAPASSSEAESSSSSAAPSSSESASSAASSSADQTPITISVASLIPGSTDEATAQFNNQVKQFEQVYPWITLKSETYQWTGPTFAAKLAAGTLPTVFTVPFTDGRTLGENGQLADLTAQAKALPYFDKFNPAVIAEGTTSDGKVVAIPTAAYAQALHYNRALFTQAGLDPNKPPTTWDELMTDAKTITAKTGKAGFAAMAKNDNTGGWILTTTVYSLGGRMVDGTGKSATATLNNPQTVDALKMYQQMRWTDNSMGSNFSMGWSDINQQFAAGQIGMYISGSDVYTNLVQASKINPDIYGVTTIPLADSSNAGVLGGGTLAAVRPDANEAAKDAAMKWIDFFYMQPLVDKDQAVRNAESLKANNQPVGVPALPVFNQEQYQTAQGWIQPYINVPTAQFKPFTDNICDQTLVAEPSPSTQSVYHALDTVVQAVLTNKNANVDQLLATANDQAQQAIKSGK